MKKAKIYIPSKTATQSGRNNSKKWVLEFFKDNSNNDHLMNWESTTDTQSQVKLYFDDKDSAINCKSFLMNSNLSVLPEQDEEQFESNQWLHNPVKFC